MISQENRVRVDFSQLSEEQLAEIVAAGAHEVGMTAYRVAQQLKILRLGVRQNQPKAKEAIQSAEAALIPEVEYALLAALLGWEVPELEPEKDPSYQDFPPEDSYPFREIE